MPQRAFTPLLFALLALFLCREALAPGHILGVWSGEAWGRIFVTHQLLRWLTGQAPLGHADLLAWPHDSRFWPIDPTLQLLQIPGEILSPSGGGLALAAAGVLFLNGWATDRLARRLGATPLPAAMAGLLVTLAPYLLRNLQDAVLEPTAVGMAALAAEALVITLPAPSRRHLLFTAGAVLLLGLTSPYLAVYFALTCALALPFTLHLLRGWLRVVAVSALACLLALAPLRWAESGEHGRFHASSATASLSPPPGGHMGGYSLDPGPLVHPHQNKGPSSSSETDRRGPLHANPIPPRQPWILQEVRAIPGGAVLLLATVLGLLLPGGRRWAGLGTLIWLLGPGLPLALRALHIRSVPPFLLNPLQQVLSALPLTHSLGNPPRLLAAWILLVAVGIALSASGKGWWRRGLAVLLALLAVAETAMVLPPFHLPTTPLPAVARQPALLAALEGPTTVFPCGDYPFFHPSVAPKEALLLAGLAGVPVPYDYGRWRVPADLALQRSLTAAALTVHSIRTTEVPADGQETSAAPQSLLLLEDRLSAEGVTGVRAWLVAQGAEEITRSPEASVWRL